MITTHKRAKHARTNTKAETKRSTLDESTTATATTTIANNETTTVGNSDATHSTEVAQTKPTQHEQQNSLLSSRIRPRAWLKQLDSSSSVMSALKFKIIDPHSSQKCYVWIWSKIEGYDAMYKLPSVQRALVGRSHRNFVLKFRCLS